MKKIILCFLFMLLGVSSYADEVVGTYHNDFDGLDYSVSVRENDGELQYIYVYMATANKTSGYFAFKGKHIDEFITALAQIRAKYVEWSKVAKEENVTKIIKEFDFELPGGSFFWNGSQLWIAKGKLHAQFIVVDGKPFVSFARSVSALTNKYIKETFYTTFSSVEAYDNFISIFDKSKMLETAKSIKDSESKFK